MKIHRKAWYAVIAMTFIFNIVAAFDGVILMLFGCAMVKDMILAVANAGMAVWCADDFDYLVSTLALKSRRIF